MGSRQCELGRCGLVKLSRKSEEEVRPLVRTLLYKTVSKPCRDLAVRLDFK